MLIREATIDDAQALPAIDVSSAQLFKIIPELAWIADAEAMPLEKHQHFISEGKVWIAEKAGQIIGFIITKAHTQHLHIYELSVALSFQRQGVGRALVAKAYQYAVQNNFTDISLTTFRNISWNAPFYKKLGFDIAEKESQPNWLMDILEKEQSVFVGNQRCAMNRIVNQQYAFLD